MAEWFDTGSDKWFCERGYVWRINGKYEAWIKIRQFDGIKERWIGDFNDLERAKSRVEKYQEV